MHGIQTWGSGKRFSNPAKVIAYIDDHKLLRLAVLAAIPLLVMFKRSSGGRAEHVVIGE